MISKSSYLHQFTAVLGQMHLLEKDLDDFLVCALAQHILVQNPGCSFTHQRENDEKVLHIIYIVFNINLCIEYKHIITHINEFTTTRNK